ncbi:CYTH domain-containing protein [Schleiferiaceae bacterium]|nr:CYTH domain-containing protein [Schleiferiaceae bacterium]
MSVEIERKFLVISDTWQNQVIKRVHLKQGYLQTVSERTVRVRTRDHEAFLTIKGKTSGISRVEYEYSIPYNEGLELLELSENIPIEKVRHIVVHDGLTWEIDVFEGLNTGLIIAEIELQTEHQEFSLPNWAGEEVSQDARYYNSALSIRPFSNWE